MALNEPSGTAARRTRWTIFAALLFVSAMLTGGFTDRWAGPSLASSSSPASPRDARRGVHHPARGQRGQGQEHRTPTAMTSSRATTRGEAGGSVRRGLTVFDYERPPVANLNPDLLDAVRRAALDAASRDGVKIVINSGWRSPEYQERLRRQAASKYGSEENAARWVATAGTSSHVSGQAVDIGPSRAMAWLSRHGAGYGLCQIYRNEPWHYELRPEAITDGCPSMYADPRHDPRMQQ
jgi:hypothetical protein